MRHWSGILNGLEYIWNSHVVSEESCRMWLSRVIPLFPYLSSCISCLFLHCRHSQKAHFSQKKSKNLFISFFSLFFSGCPNKQTKRCWVGTNKPVPLVTNRRCVGIIFSIISNKPKQLFCQLRATWHQLNSLRSPPPLWEVSPLVVYQSETRGGDFFNFGKFSKKSSLRMFWKAQKRSFKQFGGGRFLGSRIKGISPLVVYQSKTRGEIP